MNTRQSWIRAALSAGAALLVAASAAAPTSEKSQTPEARPAARSSAGATVASKPKSLHPNFALLDAQAVNVLKSGRAVSTMKTCGQCHDSDFIASHAFHADLGLGSFAAADRSWDASGFPVGNAVAIGWICA